MSVRAVAGLLLVMLPSVTALAQTAARRDTLRLRDLQAAATRVDPRGEQLTLERRASALRLRTITADRLPALHGEALAQYQSAVTTIPIRLPNVTAPVPPKDRYDAQVVAEVAIHRGDGTREGVHGQVRILVRRNERVLRV